MAYILSIQMAIKCSEQQWKKSKTLSIAMTEFYLPSTITYQSAKENVGFLSFGFS
jgi:hypothetical protein